MEAEVTVSGVDTSKSYAIVEGNSKADLEARVESLVAWGFKPTGGCFAITESRGGYTTARSDSKWYQAVWREF